MSRDTVVLFLSFLAILAQLTVVVIIVAFVVPAARGPRAFIVDQLGSIGGDFAFMVAAVAMAGSLYLSEGAHFVPCKLCWYQRIAMYSLAVVLGVAALRRRRDVALYAAPLAAIGAGISVYHMLIEQFPRLESSVCDVSAPCTLIWTKRFGFETIPTMAFSGFVLILSALFLGRTFDREARSHTGGVNE
jgi:disulfide bond formation protein DsbB